MFRSMRVSKKWLEAIRTIKLDVLDLRSFYGALEDEHVISLISKHPNMHAIRLHAAPRVTEKSMKHLGKLSHLTELDVSNCRNLTDGSLSKIPTDRLHALTSLTVSHCGFTERSLKLGSAPNLTCLNISYCDALKSGVGHTILQVMPSLTKLDASCSPSLSNDFLGHLCKLSTLTWLSLRNSHGFDHNGFAMFCGEPPKSSLSPQPPANGDLKLPQLKTLDVSSTFLNNDSLLKLCRYYPSLTELSVSFCSRLDDDGTGSLDSLTNLQHLSISYTDISTRTLKKIAVIPNLESLAIAGCKAVRPYLKDFQARYPRISVFYKSTTSQAPKSEDD